MGECLVGDCPVGECPVGECPRQKQRPLPVMFVSLGVRSLANASRARQF